MNAPFTVDEPGISPLFSEVSIAEAFAERHKEELRFISTQGRWLKFDGKVWREEKTRAAFDKAKVICKEFAAKCNKPKDAKALTSAKTIAAVERIAMADRRLAARDDQWDQDPFLLNTPDGVVDLKTGKMRPHRADDYMTKMTAVGPSEKADCPLWKAHLKTVMNGDKERIDFLQRYFGYSLTGSIEEHAMLFCHGDGGGGKGTTVNTFSHVLGNYAAVADMETFTFSKIQRHSTDIASLRGARFVTASETEEGRGWAEARIKNMTGGDPITARFMRQDNFTFNPQFKLCLLGNHKPHIRSVDNSLRRRLNLLLFTAKIVKVDLELPEKLKKEAAGILRWAIDGCLEWQRHKLNAPDVIKKATDEYLKSEDTRTEWFKRTFVHDNSTPGLFTLEMYGHWKLYAESRGEFPGTMKALSTWLDERSEKLGIEKSEVRKMVASEVKRGAGFMGVRFKEAADGEKPETMNDGAM